MRFQIGDQVRYRSDVNDRKSAWWWGYAEIYFYHKQGPQGPYYTVRIFEVSEPMSDHEFAHYLPWLLVPTDARWI